MKFLKIELGVGNPRLYTYGWNGTAAPERGDFVLVPPNSYNPFPSIGRVARVMDLPDFTGTCTVLNQKVLASTEQVQVHQGKAGYFGDEVL